MTTPLMVIVMVIYAGLAVSWGLKRSWADVIIWSGYSFSLIGFILKAQGE